VLALFTPTTTFSWACIIYSHYNLLMSLHYLLPLQPSHELALFTPTTTFSCTCIIYSHYNLPMYLHYLLSLQPSQVTVTKNALRSKSIIYNNSKRYARHYSAERAPGK
jgi:hypothetical protein